MNVKEFIEELSKLPQDAVVVSLGGEGSNDELSVVEGPSLMWATVQFGGIVGPTSTEPKPGYSAIVIV